MRQCWNWQTGTFEGRVSLTYGFKSHLPHQSRTSTRKPRSSFFLYYGCVLAFIAGIFLQRNSIWLSPDIIRVPGSVLLFCRFTCGKHFFIIQLQTESERNSCSDSFYFYKRYSRMECRYFLFRLLPTL